MDNLCFTNRLCINIENDALIISRCCHHQKIFENCHIIKLSDLPKNDNELKSLLLKKGNEVPKSFRELSPQEHCRTTSSCKLSFSNKIFFVNINKYDCNLRCTMCRCPPKSSQKERDIYKKLLFLFKDAPSLVPNLQGEPFIEKELLFQLLETGAHLDIVSNLTLLNDSDIFKLAKYKNNVGIKGSIDSIIRDSYIKIRVPANESIYNKVIHNASLLAELKILKSICITVTEYNCSREDLENTILWCLSLGVSPEIDVDKFNKSLYSQDSVKYIMNKYPNFWRF